MKTYQKVVSFFMRVIPQLYQVPILVYHSIDGVGQGAITARVFKSHLDFFEKNGYRAVSLQELAGLIKNKDAARAPLIALTFDDGYEDCYRIAYPLLKKAGYPAALFATFNRIGHPGYVTFAQLKEMAEAQVMTIGSHTMTHTDLLRLDTQGARYEIEDSKKALQDSLQLPVEFFAYPWGAFSADIQDIVKQAGYRAAFSTNSKIGAALKTRDLFALRRMTAAARDSFLRFLVKTSGFGSCFARRVKPRGLR